MTCACHLPHRAPGHTTVGTRSLPELTQGMSELTGIVLQPLPIPGEI